MDTLTLVTWNVRYFGHGTRGLRATHTGVKDVAKALASLEVVPDFVCLQEVESSSLRGGLHAQPQLERLMAALHDQLLPRDVRYHSFYFPAHIYSTPLVPLYTTGLAVLVREPFVVTRHNAQAPIDITHRRFQLTAKWKQTRVCAHVRVDVGGGRSLDLFNTHLSLPAFFTSDLPRLPYRMGHGANQVEEVRSLLAFMDENRGEHMVLVGDFNSLPDSPAYQTVVDAGLVDAFRGTIPKDRHDLWATNGVFTFRMHIDHVFSTPNIRWTTFDESHTVDERGRFFGISDHVPKVGRLVLT